MNVEQKSVYFSLIGNERINYNKNLFFYLKIIFRLNTQPN